MDASSPTALPGPLRVLTPRERPPRPLPRWTWWLLAAALVSQLLASWTGVELLDQLANLAAVLAAFATLVLAGWLEGRVCQALARRSPALRVVVALALPLCSLMVGMLAAGLLGLVLEQIGLKALAPLLALGAYWFSLASAGSAVVLLIDLGVSRVVSSFRNRIIAAVLGLLSFALTVSLLVSLGAVWLLNQLRAHPEKTRLFVQISEREKWGTEEVQAFLGEHPLALPAGALLLAGLLGLPALLSACAKLADAVMERLHPLTVGFDLVAQGKRDVRVEEAGSRDFVELARRFNGMVEALLRTERMERAFGTYVSAQVLERIRSQHGAAVIPASLRVATVFFADIRGFTTLSERLPPPTVLELLNRYFARVIPIIDLHHGFLNKFIGDAVVVVFNGPIDQPDHPRRAARCALAVLEEVDRLNQQGAFPEAGRLELGIGLATGPMVCGNVGSERQMEYTVIGDTVNLAARLTGLAAPGEVWLSEATAKELPTELETDPLAPLTVKGKTAPVVPHRLRRAPSTEAVASSAAGSLS